MKSFLRRAYFSRGWWAEAPSIPGTPVDPPVEPGNTAPVVANAIPDQIGTEGVLFNFAFAANTFSDADLDALTYSATLANGSALPAWLTFTPATRTFNGTPPTDVTISILVTADDGRGGTVGDIFALTVAAVNNIPVLDFPIADQVATEGQLFTFAFAANTFSDPDLDPLTYTATQANGSALPAWLTFTPATREFSGTPPSVITMSIKVTADDGQGGTVTDTFGLDVQSAVEDVPTLLLTDGVVTASYMPLSNERNKPPVIEDLEITSSVANIEVGATLTATITGHLQGPFTFGAHEYQWYTATQIMDAVLTPITGATSNTYVLQSTDYGKYITCRARMVQLEGSNNTSEYMYAELTTAVLAETPVDDGDITHAWADFFEIENGGSIPSNWNDSGVAVSLINLGDEADWTATATSKPAFDVNKLVFANAHRVTGYSTDHPPVFEVWMKARFTGGIGNILSMGNQTLFGVDSSGNYVSNGLTPQTGDTTEHIFRVVFNGASSFFQYDGGEEIGFDENTSAGNILVMGQTNGGALLGDFEIKRFQRTQSGTLLTTQEAIDKWAYHGFTVGGGELEDITHNWEDFFDIETGASVPADWNDAGVSPSLVNLGTNTNWTTAELTKPTYDSVNGELVFANAHKVTGIVQTFPPVVEIWIKGKFTANNGAMVGWGSQTLFGQNSAGEYLIRDITFGAGDLTEHVFRIVLNGANSIFQVDNGAETVFTSTFTSATSLALGQSFTGANPGDFRIKRFQRTADGTVLTAQEVQDKWAYHGY